MAKGDLGQRLENDQSGNLAAYRSRRLIWINPDRSLWRRFIQWVGTRRPLMKVNAASETAGHLLTLDLGPYHQLPAVGITPRFDERASRAPMNEVAPWHG